MEFLSVDQDKYQRTSCLTWSNDQRSSVPTSSLSDCYLDCVYLFPNHLCFHSMYPENMFLNAPILFISWYQVSMHYLWRKKRESSLRGKKCQMTAWVLSCTCCASIMQVFCSSRVILSNEDITLLRFCCNSQLETVFQSAIPKKRMLQWWAGVHASIGLSDGAHAIHAS